jgi:delta8-fatty-acid desaturase
MPKHRIGRVELPYANLIPPIRLPDYYINLEKRKAKKEAAIGVSHTDNEKSRRGRSVDLGTVGLSHILRLSHTCCMPPTSTQLT